MSQMRPQHGRAAKLRRKRFGRAWRDDLVMAGHHNEGRPAQQLWIHPLAANPPQSATRVVVAVPGARAILRYPQSQRHPVVEPVFERDEAASLVTAGI